jgi:DUF1680 family protein
LDVSRPLEPAVVVPRDLQGYVKLAILASGESTDGSAGQLYNEEGAGLATTEPLVLTLVPYFARGNRLGAAMRVWVPACHSQSEAQQTELV